MKRASLLTLCALTSALGACVAGPISNEASSSQAPPSSSASPEGGVAPAALVPQPAACERVVIETAQGPLSVAVEIAATPAARRRGLMGRQELPSGTGMLFVFDEMAVQTFWMRNTPLSLDMIFISGPATGVGAQIVGIVHEAEPRSHEIRSVEAPSRFVLEVPGGWSKANGVSSGMPVTFQRGRAAKRSP